MTDKGFHVGIVGGGIGGLALAQGLKKAGISVALYERDRTPTDRLQGYRVHISPKGSVALHDCLPPDVTALSVSVSRWPRSPLFGLYADLVAPAIGVQLVPRALQRFH